MNKKLYFKILSFATIMSLSAPLFANTAVSGFINAEYNQFGIKHESANEDQKPPYSGFDLQRVGIGFEHDQDIYTAIAQLQIEHGMQFKNSADGNGTLASDNNGFGEMSLERAWIQARFNDAFKLKFGKEQTPTLWERAHYPSIYTPITQPQIEENVFEEYMTGLLAEGNLPAGFVYNAWLTKARNSVDSTQKVTDTNTLPPTTGGRFGWEYNGKDGAFYLGAIGATYHENPKKHSVWGAETSMNLGKATLWAEYNKGNNTRGWYVMPSYTFLLSKKEMELTPYVLYDVFNNNDVGSAARKITAIGINFKPEPYLTVKAEASSVAANNQEEANKALRLGVIYYFN